MVQDTNVFIQEPYSVSVNKKHQFHQVHLFNCQHSIFRIQKGAPLFKIIWLLHFPASNGDILEIHNLEHILPLSSSCHLFSTSFPNKACWNEEQFLLTCQHHLLSTLTLRRHIKARQNYSVTSSLSSPVNPGSPSDEYGHGNEMDSPPPVFLFNSLLTTRSTLPDLTYQNTLFNSSCPQINRLSAPSLSPPQRNKKNPMHFVNTIFASQPMRTLQVWFLIQRYYVVMPA